MGHQQNIESDQDLPQDRRDFAIDFYANNRDGGYGEIFHRFNDRLYEWEHLAAPRKNGMKMKGKKKKNEVLFNAA